MSPKRKRAGSRSTKALSGREGQGQIWRFIDKYPKYKRPGGLLSPPLEITAAMVRGLRMVDETVVVHGDLKGTGTAVPRRSAKRGGS